MHRSSSRVLAVIDDRLEALVSQIDGARAGGVKAVHRARVASRRLREALPVAGASAGEREVRKAARRVRALTRVLGPVREVDVALGLIDDLAPSLGSLPAAAVDATRTHLAAARTSARVALLAALEPAQVARTLEVVGRMREGVDPLDPAWRGVLASRIAGRAARLAAGIERAGVLYAADALHAVRIAAKKLRYALELAGDLRAAATSRSVAALKQAQDLLGDLHDRDVLAGHAAAAAAGSPLVLAGAEAALAGRLHEQCRQLHAAYLESRHVLLGVARHATGTVAPVVRRQRRPVARARLARRVVARAG